MYNNEIMNFLILKDIFIVVPILAVIAVVAVSISTFLKELDKLEDSCNGNCVQGRKCDCKQSKDQK